MPLARSSIGDRKHSVTLRDVLPFPSPSAALVSFRTHSLAARQSESLCACPRQLIYVVQTVDKETDCFSRVEHLIIAERPKEESDLHVDIINLCCISSERTIFFQQDQELHESFSGDLGARIQTRLLCK